MANYRQGIINCQCDYLVYFNLALFNLYAIYVNVKCITMLIELPNDLKQSLFLLDRFFRVFDASSFQ